MSLVRLTDRISEFIRERDWEQFHSPRNLAAALNVEAGELLEHFLWDDPTFDDLRNDEERKRAVARELSDVMIFTLEMYRRLGADPVEAVEEKMRINAEKYPVEKAKGRSDKYRRLV